MNLETGVAPLGAPTVGEERTQAGRHTIAAVIPLYNGARFIEEALGSVLCQTRPPDEIIVVDDGSSDQGPELVAKMALRGPITLILKPNGGQSSARNLGIRSSKSSLIALLDQDDLWYPRHLELLERPFLFHPEADRIGWVSSDLDVMDEKGNLTQRQALLWYDKMNDKTNLIHYIREDLFILPSASIFLKSAFDSVGGFDEELSGYEDDDFFLRLFLARYLNHRLNESLSGWRMHRGSSSQSATMARSRMRYARKLFSLFPDGACSDQLSSRYIAPRFLKTIIFDDLVPAMKSRNFEALDPIVQNLEQIMEFATPKLQRKMRLRIKLIKFSAKLNSKVVLTFVARRLRKMWH